MNISKIRKRDGTIVKFKQKKVIAAIEKTMLAVGIEDENLAESLAEKAIRLAESSFPEGHIISVEEMQDIVEKTLINEGQAKMAKAYILYRQKRTELRKLKKNILGRLDDSKLSVNGLLIAKSKYLAKKSPSETESPKEMFMRIARAAADVERNFGKPEDEITNIGENFFEIMRLLEFIPSGRILANAGIKNNMLYSNFVIPIEDSMKGIFKALYHKALVQRLGGGTGFSFSKIRPKGAKLTTTSGYASGPIAFIKLFDYASDLTIVEGNRKPANMGSLSVDHPDIIEFITMKERNEIKNFNISVEITDEFMNAVKSNEKYSLKDPNTGKPIEYIDANNIFHLIVTMAWKTGDPGVLFIDKINESNPLPELARIETTDPCGDQLLLPYEAGHLGAINLSKFVRNKKIKWKQLEKTTRLAVRFLDNIIELSKFPIKKIEDMARGGRRIGLGVMGFADMLYKLEIPYNSEKGLETAEKIIKFISNTAIEASKELAEERAVFPFYRQSIFYDKIRLRNCSLISISPTGSRSILADTSPGIEPNFALGYTRKILGNTEIMHLNPVLEDVLKSLDKYNEENVRKIIQQNSIEGLGLPEKYKRIFVTAHEISPEWHIRMQSIFQKHIDNAISKTINFPKNATIEDIKKSFLLAYDLGCKGITVYREGSLSSQVINIGR